MPFLHGLIRTGACYPFTAYSDPPTVTLPRLKGLTTGASPSFLDAITNLDEGDTSSSLVLLDSWLRQLQLSNRTLHMYGDDTWLKLFPGFFAAQDGTSSFFVSDYTEVDFNVTRHLDSELGPGAAWDALVLHYLGLDHIGHKLGPRNPVMRAKQAEMDGIVQRIYENMDAKTLLVLAGDHGMNEIGNHGGASRGETSAALALVSRSFNRPLDAPRPASPDYAYYSQIRQVDLVTTLAYLLGFPIPLNSVGLFIEDLLPLYSAGEKLQILNSQCDHFATEGCSEELLQQKQQQLVRAGSQYNLGYMYSGLVTLLTSSLVSVALVLRWMPRNASLVWWTLVPVLYFAGMLGSSTVEEEHLIWYWLLTSYLLFLLIRAPTTTDRARLLYILTCFRVIRGYRSTGQKWVSLYDTTTFFTNHPYVMHLAVTVAFIVLSLKPSTLRMIATSQVYIYKFLTTLYPLSTPLLVWHARACFAMSLLDSINFKSIPDLFYVMLAKNSNIPLWPVMLSAKDVFRTTHMGTEYRELLSLMLEFATFFAMGGSNSIATVDLSNAYHGIRGYNIALVAVLTYLANWSQSLIWVDFSAKFSNQYGQYRIAKTAFYSTGALAICLACLILREHLFIWTVFAPKLLYTGAWLLAHAILADLAGALISKAVSYL